MKVLERKRDSGERPFGCAHGTQVASGERGKRRHGADPSGLRGKPIATERNGWDKES